MIHLLLTSKLVQTLKRVYLFRDTDGFGKDRKAAYEKILPMILTHCKAWIWVTSTSSFTLLRAALVLPLVLLWQISI